MISSRAGPLAQFFLARTAAQRAVAAAEILARAAADIRRCRRTTPPTVIASGIRNSSVSSFSISSIRSLIAAARRRCADETFEKMLLAMPGT